MKKEKRLNLILTIIEQNNFSKKQEIADYMAQHFGIHYSLTTIARDLQELEIYRIPYKNNMYFYKRIDQFKELDIKRKLEIYQDEIIDILLKDSYVLVKTSPGFAQCINYYVDQLQMEEVLGSIGGNDMFMLLTSSNEMAQYIYYKMQKLKNKY
ncbi:arginine repressor [Staphylococcus simiae]|uniref:Arginine repressor n=1 Tax=Staphylococcus simiae CCM 7213 = CCUG 51256 TaxID=911238 RepID=G5JK34_9STAP|nr:ArgR family transcriptional regulator [Staphylococcus simiae]EHJ07456.1 arginine repressor [Staphylococcus simiae CCM 7213 = CCUG 51256]PNZ13218.1 ArgR family transcriptional regulator [Staphylococcus simiae]SNV54941.1 Arginine pathway regulatory protein ArgR,repressor of arg regulon [Staphylococcus simiae]